MSRMQNSETAVSRVVNALSPHEKKSYSFVRLINFLTSDRHGDFCLEVDVANALAKELPQTPEIGCLWAPLSLAGQRSGLDSKSGQSGGFTAGIDVSQDLIELLRARLLLARLGAQILSLDAIRAFPVESSGSSATWVTENPGSDISESDMSYGQRVAVPHSVMITSAISRKLLTQTNSRTEGFVRADLARAIATELDRVAIAGTGLSNQPLGLLKTVGIGSVTDSGGNGSVPNFDDVLNLELALGKNNADVDTSAYIATPNLRYIMKQTQEISGSSRMLWVGNIMNGYTALASNNVPADLVAGSSSACHGLILGDWQQMLLCLFGGGVALLADGFSLKKRGMVELTAYLDCDSVVRRPESFAAKQDCTLS